MEKKEAVDTNNKRINGKKEKEEKKDKIQWYAISSDETLKALGSTASGLSDSEAESRLKKYGKNEIKEKHTKVITILLKQFNSILIYILLFASLISALFGHWIDFYVIMAIVVINGILGFVQDYKAEKAIQKLKQFLKPQVIVKRDNKIKKIDSSDLVPGDIIVLQAGDKVMADCRIIQTSNLMTNDAAITGESLPQSKFTKPLKAETNLAERDNMAWQGSTVVEGNGLGVVVETGMNTFYGKIAGMIETKGVKTPLQVKLNVFSKKLGIIILILSSILFIVGWLFGLGILRTFLTSISLAVAAVPEGLPAVVTIALSIALQRMLRVNTLVRKLPAAEGLGSVTAICTDKTGTLTSEELTVKSITTPSAEYKVEGHGFNIEGSILYGKDKIKFDKNDNKKHIELFMILKAATLCNNSATSGNLGDPTELALMYAAEKVGINKKVLSGKRISEFPFSSERKMMSVIVQEDNKKTVYSKGSPEKILDISYSYFSNGKIVFMTQEKKQQFMKQYEDLAGKGYRVIGLAFKPFSAYKPKKELAEQKLIFLGFMSMIDPPKKGVKEAISVCKQAGIKVFMITGDSKLTAMAVAKDIGLEGQAVEGKDIDNLTSYELAKKLDTLKIFARTSPEHKIKIIEALRIRKEIIAMFGDGINDAPALKKADIGVAMGKRGTEVTKEVADIILVDDNFSSMVKGVKEGRLVMDNIKKFVNYLLTCNVAEVLIVFVAVLFRKFVLFPSQILWINLLTDGLPAVALAADPANPGIMKRKAKRQQIMDKQLTWLIFGIGIKKAALLLSMFFASLILFKEDVAITMLFTAVILYEFNRIFVIRLTEKLGMFVNKWVNLAVVLSIFLQLALIYSPMGKAFHVVPLGIMPWVFIISTILVGTLSSYSITKVILKYIKNN